MLPTLRLHPPLMNTQLRRAQSKVVREEIWDFGDLTEGWISLGAGEVRETIIIIIINLI